MPRAPSIAARTAAVLRESAQWAPCGAAVLAGISGGADSMALLYLAAACARRHRWRLCAVHVHHGLRGRAADGDAAFVAAACARLGVDCVIERVEVARAAREAGVSVEMAAREARRAAFARQAEAWGAHTLLLGHTLDDQAETMLLRFARGAGRTGLGGIRPIRTLDGLTRVRPLLGWRRAEVEAFLRAHRWSWREDRSNRSPVHLRNRVRRQILPLLERTLNPALRETLARNAELWADEDRYLDAQARAAARRANAPGGGWRAARLAALDPALRRRVLRAALADAGLPAEHLDAGAVERAARALERGAQAARAREELGGGWTMEVMRGIGRIRTPAAAPAPAMPTLRLAPPGRAADAASGWTFSATRARGFRRAPERGLDRGPAAAWISAARAAGKTLMLRPLRSGDRFRPLGMRSDVRVRDALAAAGVSVEARRRAVVVECEGAIAWVPGFRVAHDWAVPSSDAPSFRLCFM